MSGGGVGGGGGGEGGGVCWDLFFLLQIHSAVRMVGKLLVYK